MRKRFVFAGLLASGAVSVLLYVSWRLFRHRGKALKEFKVCTFNSPLQFLLKRTKMPKDEQNEGPPDEYLCPITKDLMACPVFTADGHTCDSARWNS